MRTKYNSQRFAHKLEATSMLGTPTASLTVLLKEIKSKSMEIGLTVKVVIGDQGIHNQGLFKTLNISPEQPYYFWEGEKIDFMFDPHHFFKSVRNNLAKYNIQIGTKTIKWKYIERFYLQEKSRGNTWCRGAYKLTDKHIFLFLPTFSKMSVKGAAQVLIRTVAAGLNTHVGLGDLPSEAIYTSEYIYNDCFLLKITHHGSNTMIAFN